jgi:hypothetical protein
VMDSDGDVGSLSLPSLSSCAAEVYVDVGIYRRNK